MKKEVVFLLLSTIYVGLNGHQKMSTNWFCVCIRTVARGSTPQVESFLPYFFPRTADDIAPPLRCGTPYGDKRQ